MKGDNQSSRITSKVLIFSQVVSLLSTVILVFHTGPESAAALLVMIASVLLS